MVVCFSVLLLPWSGQKVRADDFWELPPILYSESKPGGPYVEKLHALNAGSLDLEGKDVKSRLVHLLGMLDVPVSSQVLVYSKTSLQNSLIRPGNPRALYFSRDVYVGYVPGGDFEVIVHDPKLGVVFYRIDPHGEPGMRVERDTGNCLSCHGTTRTQGVPGVLIRSVHPNADGHPLLSLGTSDVVSDTPIEERWGGYYVTGRSSLPHLGNRIFDDSEGRPRVEQALEIDLGKKISLENYPADTSDIVALVTLEHQCQLHNHLTAAAFQYERAYFLGKAFDASSDPDQETAGRIAQRAAEKIVDLIFYRNEADLGDGIEGSEDFQRDYLRDCPSTESGESLGEFLLYRRLMKNRCSPMIYSAAFRSLPRTVGAKVRERMRKVLLSDAIRDFEYLKASEKKRIAKILDDTWPDWRR